MTREEQLELLNERLLREMPEYRAQAVADECPASHGSGP